MRRIHSAPGNTVERIRQADARRRRNGPRKATFRRPITVRLRGKPCPAEGPDVPHDREKSSSRVQERRHSQQADVGTKTRSAGRVACRRWGVRRARDAGPGDAGPHTVPRHRLGPLPPGASRAPTDPARSSPFGGRLTPIESYFLLSRPKAPANRVPGARDDPASDGYTHFQPSGVPQANGARTEGGPTRHTLPAVGGEQSQPGRRLHDGHAMKGVLWTSSSKVDALV